MGRVNELSEFTRGQLDSAHMKIGHDVGMGTADALRAFLSDRLKVVWNWKVWKTIKLGAYANADSAREALRSVLFNFPVEVIGLLDSPDLIFAKEETKIDLVKVELTDLHLSMGSTYEEVCSRAKKVGLALCPQEVGFHLRMQYTEQPWDEIVYVVSRQIHDKYGRPCLFKVKRKEGKVCFEAAHVPNNCHFYGGLSFVFQPLKVA